jgi:hypothetical protein
VEAESGFKIINLFKAARLAGRLSDRSRKCRHCGGGGASALGTLYGVTFDVWREPQFIVDANGVESLNEKGKGRLAWKDIAMVRLVDDALRVTSTGGAAISVKIKEIDKKPPEIFAAIGRHRPDVLPADGRRAATT